MAHPMGARQPVLIDGCRARRARASSIDCQIEEALGFAGSGKNNPEAPVVSVPDDISTAEAVLKSKGIGALGARLAMALKPSPTVDDEAIVVALMERLDEVLSLTYRRATLLGWVRGTETPSSLELRLIEACAGCAGFLS